MEFKPIKETVTTGAFADFTTNVISFDADRKNKKPHVHKLDKHGRTKEEEKKKSLQERIDERVNALPHSSMKDTLEKLVYLFENTLVFADCVHNAQRLAKTTNRPQKMHLRIPQNTSVPELITQLSEGKLDVFKVDEHRLAAALPNSEGAKIEIKQIIGEDGTPSGNVISEWHFPHNIPVKPGSGGFPQEEYPSQGIVWYLYINGQLAASSPDRNELEEEGHNSGMPYEVIEDKPEGDVEIPVGPAESDVSEEELEKYTVPYEDEETDIDASNMMGESYNDNYEKSLEQRARTNQAPDGKVTSNGKIFKKRFAGGNAPIVGETYTENNQSYKIMSGLFESDGSHYYLVECFGCGKAHSMMYPERRMCTDQEVLGMARDAFENGQIEGGFENDVEEAKRQLADAGLAEFSVEPLQPISVEEIESELERDIPDIDEGHPEAPEF